jgi:outer membrane protein assembly factor BamB
MQDYVFGRSVSTCAVHDGLVYASDLGGSLHCLDARTGQKYWEHPLRGAVLGSPYWVDGKVYLGTEEGKVFIFAHGKQMKLIASIEMDEPINCTPVAANGVLYVATRTHLYAISQR